jgi:hypothetical protein
MATPAIFAFLHHLCAFTLVAALAIEFVSIRSELTLANARLAHKSTIEETRSERFLSIASLPWPIASSNPPTDRSTSDRTNRLWSPKRNRFTSTRVSHPDNRSNQ